LIHEFRRLSEEETLALVISFNGASAATGEKTNTSDEQQEMSWRSCFGTVGIQLFEVADPPVGSVFRRMNTRYPMWKPYNSIHDGILDDQTEIETDMRSKRYHSNTQTSQQHMLHPAYFIRSHLCEKGTLL
jgi:hypothetical protein